MSGAPAGGAEMARDLAEAIRELLDEIAHGVGVERQWDGDLVKSMYESPAAVRARRALERWEALR